MPMKKGDHIEREHPWPSKKMIRSAVRLGLPILGYEDLDPKEMLAEIESAPLFCQKIHPGTTKVPK